MDWGKLIKRERKGDARSDTETRMRAEQLNRILERERTRADRTGRPLCMVLLGQDGKANRRKDTDIIIQVMEKRGRITDVIGRFDRTTGFAVLPDTPVQGGRRYAEIVRKRLLERGIFTSFAIYQYSPPRDKDQDSSYGGGHRLPRTPETSDTAQAGDRRRPEPVHAVAMNADTQHADRDVHDLQPLLAQRLPWWKRGMDIAVAGTALACCWPLLVGIGVAIKFDTPGPAIFKQQRSGLGGRPFDIWKFRTMVPDAEARRAELLAVNEQDGPAFKIKSDPRVTRVGALLRKTSLDELPQLVNILLGDMTLVGPRPLPIQESDACEPWQKYRLDITPGLTCIWQVWGRSAVNFNDWIRMDLRYKRKRTPQHDLKIMLCTVPAVLKQRGAC